MKIHCNHNLLSYRNNENIVINPDFSIDQRNGYINIANIPFYTDKELTNMAGNLSNTDIYNIDAILGNAARYKIKSEYRYVSSAHIKRGYVSNAYTKDIYTIDRFKTLRYGVITFEENGGIRIMKNVDSDMGYFGLETIIDENIYKLKGKSFSVSTEIDGKIYFLYVPKGWTYSNTQEILDVHYINTEGSILSFSISKTKTNNIQIRYYIGGSQPLHTTYVIKWLKLEIGMEATPFIAPDPISELLKCNYYYCEIITNRDIIVHNNELLIANITLYNKMRIINPTTKFKNDIFNEKNFVYIVNGIIYDNFEFTLSYDEITDTLSILANKSNHGLDMKNTLIVVTKGNPICIDAEIY